MFKIRSMGEFLCPVRLNRNGGNLFLPNPPAFDDVRNEFMPGGCRISPTMYGGMRLVDS